jgi:hypothetical protein
VERKARGGANTNSQERLGGFPAGGFAPILAIGSIIDFQPVDLLSRILKAQSSTSSPKGMFVLVKKEVD